MWADDPILAPGGALHGSASPVFRLSAYFPYRAAHPYTLTEAWEALFALFAPVLRDRCDRVLMWDRPGGKARRSRKIATTHWTPFRHIRSVYSNVEGGMFTGFSFLDAQDERGDSAGPASLRFFVGSSIRLDVSLPLADWEAGRLDPDGLVAALEALPHVSFLAGYGLTLSETFMHGDTGIIFDALSQYARRYPAVDVERDDYRSRFSGSERDFPAIGIAGINWLTGVGEPFRSMGGGQALARGLPAQVQVREGPNGISFRLGDRPVSGEAAIDDATLALYAALGARIRAVWTPHADMPRPPVFGDGRERDSLGWEQRFFGGPA